MTGYMLVFDSDASSVYNPCVSKDTLYLRAF